MRAGTVVLILVTACAAARGQGAERADDWSIALEANYLIGPVDGQTQTPTAAAPARRARAGRRWKRSASTTLTRSTSR